jgi:hypothetical protein
MGAVSWLLSALAVFGIARIIPSGRRSNYLRELLVALMAATLFGTIATALDFGGWRTLDWRSALFVFLGALTAVGGYRALCLASAV